MIRRSARAAWAAALFLSLQSAMIAAQGAQAAPTPMPVATPQKAEAPPESPPDAAALDAKLADLGADAGEDAVKLNLYGFADFTVTQGLTESAIFSKNTSFAVGKLNLYAAAELGDGWRSLTEVRFMFLPNGADAVAQSGATAERTDTSVADYTNLGRLKRWGGVSIERAWLERVFHPAFAVRLGQWLTPYGIWNVDHGSPVIIGVRPPYVIGGALFPEQQTGIMVYGAFAFGAAELGYSLTLSNGRGPLDTYRDLDSNKATGARLYFKHDGDFGTLTVGASGYRGKYTNAVDAYSVNSSGRLINTRPVMAQYSELSLAADAKWEWQGLLLQSEFVLQDVAYPEAHRPVDTGNIAGPPGFVPDHRQYGLYGLAGYRTRFFGVMPFTTVEYHDPGARNLNSTSAAVSGGLNVRPTARVVLKLQLSHVWQTKADRAKLVGKFNLLEFQAAWSF